MDSSNNSIVLQKAKTFSTRIANLRRYLVNEKKEYIISSQIMRSGTSIGANITEALYGISRKDFAAKMYIALKEAAETMYWIDVLYNSNNIDETGYNSIYKDCEEIKKILNRITNTVRNS